MHSIVVLLIFKSLNNFFRLLHNIVVLYTKLYESGIYKRKKM